MRWYMSWVEVDVAGTDTPEMARRALSLPEYKHLEYTDHEHPVDRINRWNREARRKEHILLYCVQRPVGPKVAA